MSRRSRVRQRQAAHVAALRRDWAITVVIPVGASGVSAALPLPLFRSLSYRPDVVERIGRAAEHYREVNRL